jgi:hypothetical protein
LAFAASDPPSASAEADHNSKRVMHAPYVHAHHTRPYPERFGEEAAGQSRCGAGLGCTLRPSRELGPGWRVLTQWTATIANESTRTIKAPPDMLRPPVLSAQCACC